MKYLKGNLLIVDDQKPVYLLLKRILSPKGNNIKTAESSAEALKILEQEDIDVIITDINMPDISGLNLLKVVKEKYPNIPVIIVTAYQEIEIIKDAFKLGAYDYIIKPFDSLDILMSVQRALEHRKLLLENIKYQRDLENIVRERTQELNIALCRLEKAFIENKKAHLESIIVLSKIAELNDQNTGNHIKRVSRYSEYLSKEMGMSSYFVDQITYSSAMHDIGKVLVDPNILKKKGRLTPEEFEKAKLHTLYGAKILEGIPFLQMAHDIALYHHENFDGTGYPTQKKGEEIPISARIVTICDVFDALVSRRHYKKPLPFQTVINIMKTEVGLKFDPEIANVFFKIKENMYEIYLELKDD